MKQLRPIFKKLSNVFLKEIPDKELENQGGMADFEVSYYEAMLTGKNQRLTVREALDCLDFVIVMERDDHYYAYWGKMSDLYQLAMNYLIKEIGFYDDPTLSQGSYEFKKVKSRYEHKLKILKAYAERKGYIVV